MAGFYVARPRAIDAIAGALDVQAGGTFTCALRADRTPACFGNNELGALARAVDNEPHAAPLAVALADVTALSAGIYHACAILADTGVACWGYNAAGQLGRGTTSPFEIAPARVREPL